MVKLTFLLRRQPHLTREAFQAYWRGEHANLVMSHADVLNIRRYVQNHTASHAINDAMQTSRGAPDPYDGTAELWFDSVEAMTAPAGTPEGKAAMRALREDEARFIDAARSPLWLTEEHVIKAD